MNIFAKALSQKNRRYPFWLLVLLPAAMLGAIIGIQFLIGDVITMSFLAFCGLLLCAYLLPYAAMCSWTLIFIVAVWIGLFIGVRTGTISEYLALIRVLSFSVASFAALGLSIYRSRLQNTVADILHLLTIIPEPIAISDRNGVIRFVNAKAKSLLEKTDTEIIGESVFALFIEPQNQGKVIAHYIDAIDRAQRIDSKIEFCLRKNPAMRLAAEFTRVELGGTPFLAMMLTDVRDESAGPVSV